MSSAKCSLSSAIRKPSKDRKSTRLNSSHTVISYAVFCLKKKKQKSRTLRRQRAHRDLIYDCLHRRVDDRDFDLECKQSLLVLDLVVLACYGASAPCVRL